MTLVLASGSAIRAQLLRNAGLEFAVVPSAVDESAIKTQYRTSTVEDLARGLAEAKAAHVAPGCPGAIVIGADQILSMGERRFDKPVSIDDARRQLLELRGKTHTLVSAVSAMKDGKCLWSCVESAQLTMRGFSDGFLDGYVRTLGSELLQSVGSYKLEGAGIQLFETIRGDYFTILGLPLLPLLEFLRRERVITR